jgi:hypothetical protein
MYLRRWQATILLFCFGMVERSSASVGTPKILASQAASDAKQGSGNPNDGSTELVGKYRGVLPCADCSGIETEVSLFAKSSTDPFNARYAIKRTYQGRATTWTEIGSWSIVRGTPDDSNATVYELKPKDGGQASYFLQVSDNEILQLDSERRRIDAKMNFSLKKVTAKAAASDPNS